MKEGAKGGEGYMGTWVVTARRYSKSYKQSHLDHTYHEQKYIDVGNTICYLINTPQWHHRFCCGISWLDRSAKPSVKADLAIYSYIVTTP